MEMIQTYQGYFQEDGQFISSGPKIPSMRRAIVTILGDEKIEPERNQEVQHGAIEEFFAEMKSIEEQGVEPIDEEFDKIMANRVNIKRFLAL